MRTALVLSLAVLSRPGPAAGAGASSAAAQGAAQTGGAVVEITARLGEHSEYGRVVFDVPEDEDFHVAHRGERVVVTFAGGPAVADGVGHARNVRDVTGGAGQAVITIAPGSRVHALRMGAHVIVDVLDPVASSRAAPQVATPAAPRPVEASVQTAGSPGPAALPAPVLSAAVPAVGGPPGPVAAPAAGGGAGVPPPAGAPDRKGGVGGEGGGFGGRRAL